MSRSIHETKKYFLELYRDPKTKPSEIKKVAKRIIYKSRLKKEIKKSRKAHKLAFIKPLDKDLLSE